MFSETKTYGTPRLYNLLKDPSESENVLFPHTWVPKAASVQLVEHMASLKKHPPIKPGILDPYHPFKKLRVSKRTTNSRRLDGRN